MFGNWSLYSTYYIIMLCIVQAHRLQIHYPKHVFLMYGSYESQWWSIEDEVSDGCSAEDRAMVLQFSLAALHYGHLHQNLSINTCQVNDCCLLVGSTLLLYTCTFPKQNRQQSVSVMVLTAAILA